MKGNKLEFISRIKGDGSGTENFIGLRTDFVDDESFYLRPLSISNQTFIASGFNSYVVKIKNKPKQP